MTNYSKGYTFELRTKKEFEELEYYVIRSAGSHGIADLVCLHEAPAFNYLVQCKTGLSNAKDMTTLAELADKLCMHWAWIWKKPGRNNIWIKTELGEYASFADFFEQDWAL